MAVSRKRKKSKPKRFSFKLSNLTRRNKQRTSWLGPSLVTMLSLLSIVCVICGIVIGLMYLEKYVKENVHAAGIIDLELAGVPLWASDELKEKVHAAAIDTNSSRPGEDIALSVQHNLEQLAWLDDIKVRSTHDRLRVESLWRKPLALVKSGRFEFYVDAERIVLDFVPLPELPIVEIKGLPPITQMPPLGEAWQRNDLAAAVMILDRLDHMDKTLTPDKPLLYEIDRIDVSNFNGRKSSRRAHIILYSKDNTEIIWGAEVGKWQRHLESTDKEKLAKLYGYYKDYGTLSGGAKYINLRDPRDKIPLPIDKY